MELDRNSSKYRQLAGTLAIDSYVRYVVGLIGDTEPLLEMVALIFENLM